MFNYSVFLSDIIFNVVYREKSNFLALIIGHTQRFKKNRLSDISYRNVIRTFNPECRRTVIQQDNISFWKLVGQHPENSRAILASDQCHILFFGADL
ncbi:hypothetical protein D3C78_1560480 [compost metagenome]